MADGLLNKASIILTPTGYKAGTLYNVAPVVEPYEDFDFARASVASRVNSSGLVEMVGRTLGSELVQNGDFSELGSELVVNGDFATDSDWSKSGSVEISGGSANFDIISGAFTRILQNITLTNSKTYKLTLQVVGDNSAKQIKVRDTASGDAGGLQENITLVEGTTNYTFYFTANANSDAIYIKRQTSSGDYEFSIDNVSIKQVDPNDYWTLQNGWSLGDDTCIVTNGPIYQRISQSLSLDLNSTYQVTIECSQFTNGYVYLRKPRGTQSDTDLRVNAVGTFQFTLQALTDIDEIALSIGAAGTNLTISSISVKEIIDTNNIPRISYDSNGENGHILLEPTSENKVTYSEDFSEWTNTDITFGTDGVSPSGETNANLIQTGTAGNDQVSKAFALSPTNTTTYSVFIKRVGGAEWIDFLIVKSGFLNSLKVWFNINTGTVGSNNANGTTTLDSASIEDYGNDWYRLIVTTTDSTNNTSFNIRVRTASADGSDTRVNNSSYYLWGMQLEALPYATSYIPTLTGSTVTRATETLTGSGNSTLINSTEGVLYAEIAALADDGTARNMALSDGTTSNRIVMVYTNVSNQIRFYLEGSGGTITVNHTLTNSTELVKAAVRYKSEYFAFYINGVQIDTNNSSITFSGLNNLSFHNPFGGGSSPFYGKCKALAVFNEALSDSELTQLTT